MPAADRTAPGKPTLTLRPASKEDGAWLRELRNDATVRAASRNPAEVSVEEHGAWLDRVLADPDRWLLICEVDGKPAGQVRLDRIREQRYEISTALAPEARGLGLAGRCMALAVERLRKSEPGAEVEAHVQKENSRSLAAVHRAGFRSTDEIDEDGFLVLVSSAR